MLQLHREYLRMHKNNDEIPIYFKGMDERLKEYKLDFEYEIEENTVIVFKKFEDEEVEVKAVISYDPRFDAFDIGAFYLKGDIELLDENERLTLSMGEYQKGTIFDPNDSVVEIHDGKEIPERHIPFFTNVIKTIRNCSLINDYKKLYML